MHPVYPPEAAVYRTKVQAFLTEKLPKNWGGTGQLQGEELEQFVAEWRVVLAEAGYLAPNWPVE